MFLVRRWVMFWMMAARLGVDHQQLQQFVSTSTWDHVEVRRRLAGWAREFVDPDAPVIRRHRVSQGQQGFPWRGADVLRRFGQDRELPDRRERARGHRLGLRGDRLAAVPAGILGRREKAADDKTSAEIRARRARSAIPDEVRHREKWRLALDMLDEVTDEWGLPQRPVVADAGYGDATEFRLGLTQRGLTYVLAVRADATAHPAKALPTTAAWVGNGRPPGPRDQDKPVDLKTLVMIAGRSAGRFVVWRHGSKKSPANPTASMRSRFLALRVRPASRNIPRAEDGTLPECWLLAEWPPGKTEPTDYWLSTLPTDIRVAGPGAAGQDPLAHRTRLPRTQRRTRPRSLRRPLLAGWRRHVTLTANAQAICTQLRRTPKAPAQA